MADLEDFFAKRDKKKPKGKKFETSADVAKILETKAKERKKQETNKSTYVAPPTEDGVAAQPTNEYRAQGTEDDEWKEAVEEKPDYTGLKIQELVLEDDDELDAKEQDGREGGDSQINDGPWKGRSQTKKEEEPVVEKPLEADIEVEPSSMPAGDELEVNTMEENVTAVSGDGDSAPKKYVAPSRRSGAEPVVSVTKPTVQQPASVEGTPTAKPTGAYVPPSRRGQTMSSSSSGSKPKKPTTAPNINDEQYFPSLGGS